MIDEIPELSRLELRMMAMSTKAFIDSRAGQELLTLIDIATNGALNAIRECTDYRNSEYLVIRYQQRVEMAELIKSHINHLLEPLSQEETGTDGDDEPDTTDTQYTN